MPRGNPYDRKITPSKKAEAPPKKAAAPNRSVPSDRPTALQRGLRTFGEYASGAAGRAGASGERPTAFQRGLSAVGERLSSSRSSASPKPAPTAAAPTPPKTPAKSAVSSDRSRSSPTAFQRGLNALANTPRTSRPARGATTSPQPASKAPASTRMARGATMPPKPAPKTPATTSRSPTTTSSTPAKFVKTKGGDYPTYDKKSDEAKSFRSAFAAARKDGAKTFMWEGRKYTTDVK